MTPYNTSMSGLSTSMSGLGSMSASNIGWVTTVAVFIIVIVTVFLISKNIRRTIYGAIVTGIVLINYRFSRWIGNATMANNYEPIKWFGYVVGFIIVSIIIGFFVQKLRFIQNFEKRLEEESEVDNIGGGLNQ